LLIYGSLGSLSGGYLYDRKLVEYLCQQGDLVEIISLPWRNYARHLSDNFSPALMARLCSLDVDILLQDELNHPSLAFLNARLKQRVAYPLVSIVHHLRSSEMQPAWQQRISSWVERRYLQSADAFIFNSQTTRKAVESAGVDLSSRADIVALPAGDRFGARLTGQQISQRVHSHKPLRIVFVGNLIPRKQVHTLLAATARLRPGNWFLEIAGSPDSDAKYAEALCRQAQKAGIAGSVRFHGKLSDSALAELLANSDILAVPSSYEGYGIVYLEGMGFGLPAIGANAGAAGEIITDQVDGFLVEPGKTEALAEILQQLSEDRSRLLQMSLAAQARFQAHPNWEQHSREIRSFLGALLQNRESRLAMPVQTGD
jgi:glycosyltransferase involved in cell wall biosynthesis